jgi:autotransporter-associated beta strand protein
MRAAIAGALAVLWGGHVGLGATATATVSVVNTPGGVTPRYLGYNMGHYMPGSNTSAWLQYSGVNAYRFWASPGDYEPTDDRSPFGDGVTSLGAADLTGFDFRKNAVRADLRANPASSTYINWSYFNANFDDTQSGRNKATLDYNLSQVQNLGVDVVMQITRSNAAQYQVADWGGKWEQWQHYYAMAFYAAKNYDVQRYQMYNEPDLDADLPQSEWVLRLQLASDAVKSAIEDVNTVTGKKLSWSMYAPVAASTVGAIDTAGNEWGRDALQANRTDYAGRPIAYDNFDTYDVHRYNSNGSSFTSDLGTFDSKIPGYNASGQNMPIAYTEFNRYNSGTYSTRADGPDTALNAVEFAGIFPGAMRANTNGLAGAKAMYAFKFSQTVWTSSSTDLDEKQKTGFNYVENDGSVYNITGSTRAAESMRLAAKAFKGERPRFQQTVSASDSTYDAASSLDRGRGNYYYLSVNRNTTSSRTVTLNLNDWNVPYGSVLSVQEVSGGSFGAGKPSQFVTVPASGSKIVTFTQPSTSAWLLTAPTMTQSVVNLSPSADAQVSNATPTTNFGLLTNAKVDRSAATSADDAAYLKFNITGQDRAKVGRAFLNITGVNSTDTEPVHVYGLLGSSWDNWTETGINWNNAPGLGLNGATDAKLVGVGTNALPVGQLTWNAATEEWGIDVTEFVRTHPDLDLSFVLIRENRFDSDPPAPGGAARPGDTDTSRVVINTREGDVSSRPRLSLYMTPNQAYYWKINAPPDPLNPLTPPSFNAPGNWDAGAPNAAGAIAVLGDFITSPRTVTMSSAATVGELRLDSWNSYTLTGSQTLTFNGGAGASSINVYKGSHQIDTPIALTTATTAFVDANLSLTISKAISGSVGLTKTGAGTLILSAASPSFTGAVSLSAGLTRVTAADAAGKSGLGTGALTVYGGSILQLENVAVGTVAVPGPSTTLATGATLRATGASQFNAPVMLAGAAMIDVASSLSIAKPLSGTGALSKTGAGSLALGAASPSFSGGTTITAGLVRLTAADGNAVTGLGTGPIVVNSGAGLQIENVALGASANPGPDFTLNSGAALTATGNASFSKSGSPMIANSGSVSIGTINSGDVLSIQSAIRNVAAAASTATINLTGPGRVALLSGGLSSTGTFAGSWNVAAGVLQLGPTISGSVEALNAPGFKNGDAKQGNLITVSGTGLLLGAVNTPQAGNVASTPSFFRAGVTLNSGRMGSTALDANFGGDLTTLGTSSIYVYDALATGTARSVNLVGGAAVAGLNNTAATNWAGALTVDPGPTASGGAFNITRTGGTIAVTPGASLVIKPRAVVNLGGAADALNDTVDFVNITDDGAFNVTTNTKNVGNIAGSGATSVTSGATLVANHIRQSSLILNGSARIRQNSTSAGVSNVTTLDVQPTGQLNLTNNKLVTATVPGTWGAGVYSGVQGQVARGRNGGTWNGLGIMTSEADALTSLTTIGVANAGEVMSLSAGETASWGGQLVNESSTLVMYTYSGDANLDGAINADDYAVIDLYSQLAGSNNYARGDFNYDGSINADDYALIDNAVANQRTPFAVREAPAMSVVAVPEPAVGVLVMAALGGCVARRRRR